MLFIQEYQGAGLDKKRSILQKIEQRGAKNCNWVHQLSSKNTTVDSTEEEVVANFLTRERFGCPVLVVLLGRSSAD